MDDDRRLHTDTQDEREEAAYASARSADPDRLGPVLDAVAARSDDPGLWRGAVDGLVDGAPATIAAAVDALDAHGDDIVAALCAEALGEIAYRQGIDRDERIPRALVAALDRLASPDSRRAAPFVAALRECARAKPLGVADDALKALMTRIAAEGDPYLFCLDNLFETLLADEGRRFLDALAARVREDPGSPVFFETAMRFLGLNLPPRDRA